MKRFMSLVALGAGLSSQAVAQPPEGWAFQLESAYLNQSDADISAASSFSADRAYLRLSGINRQASGLSYGITASLGQTDYDFTGAAPWGRVREESLSFLISGGNASGMQWFVAPSIDRRAESGASSSDGVTAGVFAGVSWEVSERLRIGPAFGAFSGLGSENAQVFPFFLLDWSMTDRLSLTTGPSLGASQGPGLSLKYRLDDSWGLAFSARKEINRFALSNSGPNPGGVGQDSSVPVIVSLTYDPNPGLSFAVFAGAEVDGQLEVESASGSTVSSQRYDAAPLVGVAFSMSF
jgi:hypothetical protein